jgi:glycyl-tRNA synthetase beta chain
MADFLLELRSEEIPARMQKGAREDLRKVFEARLAEAGLAADSIAVWSTPRRLALIARGLPMETMAVKEERKGPKADAPDAALAGFLRSTGMTREQLETRDVKGAATLFAVIDKPGRATAGVLAEVIPAIIRAFPWPKSQRWGAASASTESLKWVRPLSGVIALLDGAVVPFDVDGIVSARETMGHRFHSTGAITIDGADDYAEKLRAAYVLVDHVEREAIIRDGAAKAAADAGLTLVADEGLVVENAGLTEWPVPLLGRFDASFLDVPPEVIQLTARVNQKYFVCEDAAGKLTNAFVCTANIAATDGGAAIVEGNQKVLAARLSDAKFFWELDQKTLLEDHAKKLANIVFHEKLGTLADKVERVAKLARWLCEEGVVAGDPQMAYDAARLCKADLVTEMVGEFPELQGLMGGYYARAEGLPVEVADAIRDHYKPVGQGDDVPTAPVTVAVSLADKLDTLCLFFFEGILPTGSKDPFALRRAAIAIIELLTKNDIRLPLTFPVIDVMASFEGLAAGKMARNRLNQLIESSHLLGVPLSANQLRIIEAELIEGENADALFNKLVDERLIPSFEKVMNFFADRLKVQQKEAGVRHDLIDAVFALGGEDDLVRLLARVKALQAFVETDDGANLLAGYKRAANILKKESPSPPSSSLGSGEGRGEGGLPSEGAQPLGAGHPHPTLSLKGEGLGYEPEPAEAALIAALADAAPEAETAVADERFGDAMAALASLRQPIDAFFTDVMVNDPDPAKKAARLSLLAQIRAAVHNVADFSKIEG